MIEDVNGISGLLQSIAGTNRPVKSPTEAGGFGPDYILELGQQAFGGVPGYSLLGNLNAATTNTLHSAAAQAITPTPIFSQKQADELNGFISAAADALANRDFDEAKTQAKELLKKDFHSSIGYHLLGRISAAQGDLRGALKNFEQAAAFDPSSARYAEDVFNVRQLLRSDEEVLETGAALVQNRETALNGIRLLFELAGRSEDQGQIHLQVAEGFKTLKLPVQQLNTYEAVLEFGTQADLEQLEHDVKEFIGDHEPVGLAYSILGRAQQRLGRFEEAMVSLESARSIAPETQRYTNELANVYATRGNVALGEGRYDSAEYNFQTAHELDLPNKDIKLGLAAVKVSKAKYLMDRGLDTKARILLGRAKTLLEDDETLDKEMAQIYRELGNRALRKDLDGLALSNFQDALDRNPELAGLKRQTADLHRDMAQKILDENKEDMSTADYENLIEHYQAAFDLYSGRDSFKSDLAEGLNDFGLKLMNENEDYDRAVEMFGRARDLYPDNADYLANYNQALTLQSQEQEEE